MIAHCKLNVVRMAHEEETSTDKTYDGYGVQEIVISHLNFPLCSGALNALPI